MVSAVLEELTHGVGTLGRKTINVHLSTIISVNDAPGSVGGTGETKQFPVFAEFIF